jgi:DNA-binding transcriptional LysR family regulator
MELRQVRYFLAVARHGSFTRAAAQLHVVQPALSQQIKRLEQELGVELLDRRGGQVTVTTAGAAFLRRAESILAEVNVATAELRGFATATTGRVQLGALYTLSDGALNFPSLFSAFSAKYPDVQVLFREDTTEGLLRLLRNGQLVFALVDLSLIEDPSDLSTELLADEELVVLVNPSHPLAAVGHCRLEELANERFIRLGSGSNQRRLEVTAAAEGAGFTPYFAYLAGSVPIARALVAEGLGLHITHPWVAEGSGPPVVAVKLDGAPLRCRIVLAQRKDSYRSPAATAFVDFARETLHFRGI